jgi:hypothetical protein
MRFSTEDGREALQKRPVPIRSHDVGPRARHCENGSARPPTTPRRKAQSSYAADERRRRVSGRRAAAAAAAGAGAGAAAENKSLAGRWRRDAKATDLAALGAALEAMRLSYLQRQGALHLIDAIELEVFEDGAAASVQHLAKGNAIPQRFLAKEEFRRGAETRMRRRDLRAGEQRAVARALDAERLLVDIEWGGELPGRVDESYVLAGAGDRLEVTGRMRIGAREFLVRQVYARE